MLEKLLDISLKKTPSFACISIQEKKSLNNALRKKRAEKIAHENMKIAKRIVEQPPKIIAKSFSKEYKMYMEVRNRISRINMLAKRRNSCIKRVVSANFEDLPTARKLGALPKLNASPYIRKASMGEYEPVIETIEEM